MNIQLSVNRDLNATDILQLYQANKWSAADKPEILIKALLNSHSLVTAWDGTILVGLGNAISDGYLVVYYPHLLVLPSYQGKGVGRLIMDKMQEIYKGFHMQMLTADGNAIEFYKKNGFERAGQTETMWIYSGGDH
ncbi:putative acetyltransferase [compost metagenome]